MNWSMPIPMIPTQPRSFTSSCRSLTCSPNFSTKPPYLKGISRWVGLRKNLAFRLLEAWRNVRMDQIDITGSFKNDSKSVLILLEPLGAPVPPPITPASILICLNRRIVPFLFPSRLAPSVSCHESTPSAPHLPLTLRCCRLSLGIPFQRQVQYNNRRSRQILWS